jgi:hypothetical protein
VSILKLQPGRGLWLWTLVHALCLRSNGPILDAAADVVNGHEKAKRAVLLEEAPPVSEGSRLMITTTRVSLVIRPYGRDAVVARPLSYKRDKAILHCRW